MKSYYAKSANIHHGKITNREHTLKVSVLAEKFAEDIGMPDAARTAGFFHDFGKNSERFEGVLSGENQSIDHAFGGAAFVYFSRRLHQKRGTQLWRNYEPVIEAIQGHHDGLVSMGALAGAFVETLKDPAADCCPSGKTPSLRGNDEFQAAMVAFRADFPDYRFPKLPDRSTDSRDIVADMLDTRFLFSCLVDADYSVSASDDDPDYLDKNSREPLDADAALEALGRYRDRLIQNSRADPEVNAVRNSVYERCGEAGERPTGLFTLTAPTGVGKTLAMLNFALRHCRANALRRIIVVLPFLALAEQTEREYANIFEDILVDHSQRELPDGARELAARGDAPVIITTSVRFFESLFADRPSDCRKLHSIANSVVLFDEAQSLPSELAPATVAAVNAICRKYRCSILFSTATQPDFAALSGVDWRPAEILPENRRLYEKMRRVRTEWRLHKNAGRGKTETLSDIAEEMAGGTNVCAIVNLRRHARELFGELRKRTGSDEGVFLLTTDLCPAHRLEVVRAIRERQRDGRPCIVVATQCIEAGVDLDFDVMYRALAPLEAIIQAAGRCNRNGRLEEGRLIVFEPGEQEACGRTYPDDNYEKGAAIVKTLWAGDEELDINDPGVTAEYYRRFFADSRRNKKLEAALMARDYAGVSVEYRLIRNSGVRLIVPWEGERALFDEIRSADSVSAALLRKAAPITVSLFEREAVESCASPVCLWRNGARIETGWYILNTGFERCYDPVTGFGICDMMVENYMV